MRQHSEAYEYLIEFTNSTGASRAYGYYDSCLFNKIYDNEREEVEEVLINQYKVRDWEVIHLMPELRSVNGIEILKNEIPKLPSPSLVKAEFADVLLKATGDNYYEAILYENLMLNKEMDRNAVLMKLLRYKPSQKLYATCKNLWENDSSHIVRFFASKGLLYCAKVIIDPINTGNNNHYRYLMDALASDNIEVKNKAFEEFEKLNMGEFN